MSAPAAHAASMAEAHRRLFLEHRCPKHKESRWEPCYGHEGTPFHCCSATHGTFEENWPTRPGPEASR